MIVFSYVGLSFEKGSGEWDEGDASGCSVDTAPHSWERTRNLGGSNSAWIEGSGVGWVSDCLCMYSGDGLWGYLQRRYSRGLVWCREEEQAGNVGG